MVGFSVVRATSRNLLAAVTAHAAASLMARDGSGRHRQRHEPIIAINRYSRTGVSGSMKDRDW